MPTSPSAPPFAPSLSDPGILAALTLWSVGVAILLGVTYRDWRARRAARRSAADHEQRERLLEDAGDEGRQGMPD